MDQCVVVSKARWALPLGPKSGFGRVAVDQSSSHRTAVGADQLHQVSTLEASFHLADPDREQGGPLVFERRDRNF